MAAHKQAESMAQLNTEVKDIYLLRNYSDTKAEKIESHGI